MTGEDVTVNGARSHTVSGVTGDGDLAGGSPYGRGSARAVPSVERRLSPLEPRK